MSNIWGRRSFFCYLYFKIDESLFAAKAATFSLFPIIFIMHGREAPANEYSIAIRSSLFFIDRFMYEW